MDTDFEALFYDAGYKIDRLSYLLNLAVAILENNLADDEDIKITFLAKSEELLNEYYQSKLPFEQYKKLNKGVK